jgi:acyl-CoA thioesterase-1
LLAGLWALSTPFLSGAGAEPVRIVAFGDSLTAGLNLSQSQTFPAKLEAALKAKGYDVRIANAGVSGDTTTGGLARLDWSIPQGTQAVILELGANDVLRGISPAITRKNLEQMVDRLRARKIEILLAGIKAPPNMGGEFTAAYDTFYDEIAKKNDLIYYPFFLEGIIGDVKLNLRDGMHPSAAGVDEIVKRILPTAEKLIERVKQRSGK